MGYCCRFAASAASAAAAAAAFNLFRVLPVMLQTWNFAPRSSIWSYIIAQNFVWFRPLGPKLWGKKGVFGGKFPKTIEFTFKFYHSAFSSNGMILKFCTVFPYGSEGCVRKFCAISFIFAQITGMKFFFKVRLSLWTIKKQNFQISLLGSRSLNNNWTHFIFGIIDINNDTKQLTKKFSILSITARIIAKKGPNARLDLVSECKYWLVKFAFRPQIT